MKDNTADYGTSFYIRLKAPLYARRRFGSNVLAAYLTARRHCKGDLYTECRIHEAPTNMHPTARYSVIFRQRMAEGTREGPLIVKKSFITLAAAIFLLWQAPATAANPNLSGEWKLNLAKSDYGKFPAPLSVNRKIEDDGLKLVSITTQKGSQGEVSSKLTYTTDGKESINEVAGAQAKGTAPWIGGMLIIESSREFQGAILRQKEIWRLTSDGKILTVDAHISIPNGEFDVKQVFEKQ